MSEATFRRDLRYIVRALWESAITKSQFQAQMSKILETEFSNAWAEGAEECGIKPDEYNDEEIKALNFFISNQIDFIPGFADAIVEKNRKNEGNILSLFERAKLWLNRYLDAKNQAKSLACKDAKLEWQVGMRGCKEHCSTCLSLNGKVKRASYWQKIGIHPQSTRLACGGFRCCCGFVPTSKPLSRGRLPFLL